jgi:hypothetical protein
VVAQHPIEAKRATEVEDLTQQQTVTTNPAAVRTTVEASTEAGSRRHAFCRTVRGTGMVGQTVVVILERAMMNILVGGEMVEGGTRGQVLVGQQAAPQLEVEGQVILVNALGSCLLRCMQICALLVYANLCRPFMKLGGAVLLSTLLSTQPRMWVSPHPYPRVQEFWPMKWYLLPVEYSTMLRAGTAILGRHTSSVACIVGVASTYGYRVGALGWVWHLNHCGCGTWVSHCRCGTWVSHCGCGTWVSHCGCGTWVSHCGCGTWVSQAPGLVTVGVAPGLINVGVPHGLFTVGGMWHITMGGGPVALQVWVVPSY